MDAFHAEIPQRDGGVAAELALKVEVPLLGARIAEIVRENKQAGGAIRGGDAGEQIGISHRNGSAVEREGLHLNAVLSESRAGKDRRRDGVEDSVAAANDGLAVFTRRVGKAETRRDIARIDVNAIGSNVRRGERGVGLRTGGCA